MKKILFCGTNVPNDVEYQNKNISAAGNRFQNNLLQSLRTLPFQIFNLSYVAFQLTEQEKKVLDCGRDYAYLSKNEIHHQKGIGTVQIIKQFYQKLQNRLLEADIVFSYNVCYAWIFLPVQARRRKIKSILILADYSDTKSGKTVLAKTYARIQKWCIRQYDVVVGLSANSQKILKKNQKFLLMEGGIDETFYNIFDAQASGVEEDVDTSSIPQKQNITLLYSGLLNHVTGIDLLLESFSEMMESDILTPDEKARVKLVITGKGELADKIWELQKTKEWLHYPGHLKYDAYIDTLKTADILLNPRNMALPENLNNFPSKVMDYLATGKYILSTKFAGYERFTPYITFCEMYEMQEALVRQLKYLMEMRRDTYYKAGAEAYQRNRKFAAEFLWTAQIKRIIEAVQGE